MALFERVLVVIRGGGDLASGAVYRLVRAGFPVIVTELPAPILVRRAVSYGEAIFSQQISIEGITAHRVDVDLAQIQAALAEGIVPVVADPAGDVIRLMQPPVVVDARMQKMNPDTTLDDAPFVAALGPGYTAGVDCHAVIETNRGHRLGRVICEGMAEPNTGEPGNVNNYTHSRVLRAPTDGYVQPNGVEIGSAISANQVVAHISDQPIIAAFDGVLRGLISDQAYVHQGMKIGDLDPRARRENCFTISDKSLAVGGGVVEAVLAAPQIQALLMSRAAP